VTIADLGEAIVRLAEVLTRPARLKYLAPLMVQGGPLTSLLEETGSRPFSSTVVPAGWAATARAMLVAAEAKYERRGTATGDDWRSLAVAR
jgi:hypothetical protein